MTEGFDGRLALVTGAASGIGRAISGRLAREGCSVVLVDIDRDGVESACREIDASGLNASWYLADVSDPEQVERLHELVTAEVGTPDILVNSAGVAMAGTFDKVSLDDWRWLLGVNLWGAVHTVHYFINDFYSRGSGHIVNMASAAGLFVLPEAGLYTTSKFAMVGFSGSLRIQAAVHGVKVMTVCPGFVATPMLENVKSAEPGSIEDDTAAARRIAMSPERLIDKILAGMLKDSPVVTCPFYIKLMYGTARHLPRLWDRLMKASARAAFKGKRRRG
jgi:NAD(P)-dependent dehydrogenase (short-subunit alcohol dehydrogenase family)